MNTGSVNVGWLARLIANHGAWALFRVYPNMQSIVDNECRGESVGIASEIMKAGFRAVYAEANGSRWDAVAAFRKSLEA